MGKLEIIFLSSDYCWYINLRGHFRDINVAEYLGITFEEYVEILTAHNCTIIYSPGLDLDEYYFKNKADAEAVIKELEPLIIMAELTR